VVFPPIGGINEIHIIERHGAEPEDEKLFRIPNAQGWKVSIIFEKLPLCPIGVAEVGHVFGKDVADKPEFISLMRGIGCHDHFVAFVNQNDAAAPRETIKLENGQDN
jgi:hypothetical protein